MPELAAFYTQLLQTLVIISDYGYAGTGDHGVLTTHETSPWFSLSDAGSARPG